ncbi:MAG: hydantoinase/oxoprolinase N-terminal domain-containing protein [Parvibaculaceae bacterium]
MEKTYLVGIDTGGTYTDAAIIATPGHRVVASGKSLTTRGDLSLGVTGALEAALKAAPDPDIRGKVGLVSVSTTLATNAVVEGHGSAVAVILIGFDAGMAERAGFAQKMPNTPVERIAGGHDHNGDAAAPLDVEALEKAARLHGREAEAFAVASAFAVRNPLHERQARDVIVKATGRPVTLSSELSSALDAPRRALTAALNARLIARISALITAVERAMRGFGIVAPLMIVKGDGTLALAESVALRPIETILSGPAASVVGAAALSGLPDFILSDMGGTTTDLAIVEKGRPRIAAEGAVVGGWRTMVQAMDVRTIGLGGDSEVRIAMDGTLSVGPERVVPVSLLADRFPEVRKRLEAELADGRPNSLSARFVLLPLGSGAAEAGGLSQREAELLSSIGATPRAVADVAVSSGAQRTLSGLIRKGRAQLSALTPSDAAHVLGLQSNWSAKGARLATRLVLWQRDMADPSEERLQAFCREIWSEVARATAEVVIETAAERALAANPIVDAVCRGEAAVGLARVSITPAVPVVAVGAPVRVYYDEVGARLGTRIIYPQHWDVANAVGAATGVIARRVEIEVTGDGAGAFRVHGPSGPRIFVGAAQALEHARAEAAAAAREAVLAMGASGAEVRVTEEKRMLPDAVDDNGLFEALVAAEAVGRPELSAETAPEADALAHSLP